MNLKQRVATLLVAMVALFTLLQGGLAVLSMQDQEDELIDQFTLAEARRLAERLQHGGPELLADARAPLLGEHFEAWWLSAQGRSLPSALPSELQGLRTGPHRLSGPTGERRIVVLALQEGRLFVRFDPRANEAKQREFAWYVFTLALLVTGLAWVLARHLAAAVVAPIEHLANQLQRWAPGANPPRTCDEATQLLDAFGRVQTRLEQELADAREFAANLRHELCTPLAAARTDLEMLSLNTGTAAARQQRIARALNALDAVGSAINSVQAMSARRARLPTQALTLKHCVQDAWDSLGDLPARSGLSLSNEVQASTRVRADPHALLTLLRNLMRNAAEHAAPAHCRVRDVQGQIWLEDDGPGLPADALPLVFERYWHGRRHDTPGQAPPTAGRGLGLAIARQLAETQGWRLHAELVQPHGLRFVLSPAEFDENLTLS
jgi:signal transduction histidine kinase